MKQNTSNENFEKLMELNQLLSTVKSNNELLKIIIEKIKPIFNFYDVGIFVVDENGLTHSDWAAIQPTISPSEGNNLSNLVSKNIIHKNSPVEFVMKEISKNKKAILYDFKELFENFPRYPQFENIDFQDIGFRDCLAYNLISQGNVLGFFCINSLEKDFFKPAQFELFKTITNMVAIAVKNIITNECLSNIANIKSLELDLIKKLSEINEWEDKLLEVNKLLQPFFTNHLMMVNFEIRESKCPIYAYLRTGFNEYQQLSKDTILRISKQDADSFMKIRNNLIKTYNNPFILKGNSLVENNKNNPIKENICNHFGFKSNLIYPVKLEKYGKVIFSFYSKEETNFSEDQIRFFKSLESTLKLVLDRTLAIEEIEKLNNQLAQENSYLLEEVNSKNNFESIIGSSDVLQEVFKNVDLVANTDTTVLVLGETGTGKELIARSLHNLSSRKNNSFIKVNCAALPAQLIESELFGHEKGSFTGAFEKRIGKFELADNGSIFLDEIGELQLELQAKLLRVIQEKEFERIGGKETIKCNVRIIAATNRVLENEVEKGNFRADLYFRLNVFPIKLPPLRERVEDIPLLATYFGQKFSKKMNKPFKGIHSVMLETLSVYQWPGNIRELENVMEQAVIVSQGNESLALARELLVIKSNKSETLIAQDVSKKSIKTYAIVKEQKEALEKQAIIESLTSTKGRVRGKNGAALLLDILPTTLESKMKKYAIFKSEFGMLGQ
jgi:formate hydrogenlyase transcriptional activator